MIKGVRFSCAAAVCSALLLSYRARAQDISLMDQIIANNFDDLVLTTDEEEGLLGSVEDLLAANDGALTQDQLDELLLSSYNVDGQSIEVTEVFDDSVLEDVMEMEEMDMIKTMMEDLDAKRAAREEERAAKRAEMEERRAAKKAEMEERRKKHEERRAAKKAEMEERRAAKKAEMEDRRATKKAEMEERRKARVSSYSDKNQEEEEDSPVVVDDTVSEEPPMVEEDAPVVEENPAVVVEAAGQE